MVSENIIKEVFEKKAKLQTFDKSGKIYIPKEIRDKFKDCYFWVEEVEGKIVLDPVKLDS